MTIQQIIASIAAALGLVGVISMSIYFGSATGGVPNPINVDGQTISFAYTDSLVNEDIHIWTSTSTYTNGISHAEVYVAVLNTARAQDVELSAYFRDTSKRIADVALLTTVTQEFKTPIFSTQCIPLYDDLLATTTCTYAQTGTSTRQETKNVWAPVGVIQRTGEELTKEGTWLKGRTRTAIEGFISERKGIAIPMRRNEVAYYKVLIHFPPNQADEFYFEALGSDGAYGHLR